MVEGRLLLPVPLGTVVAYANPSVPVNQAIAGWGKSLMQGKSTMIAWYSALSIRSMGWKAIRAHYHLARDPVASVVGWTWGSWRRTSQVE